jgi:predicted DsbA family dithiol-disulfide isomerase
MPTAAVDAVLNGDDYAAAVRAEERLASDLGIRAVPTFVIADRLMVSGAQSPQVLADAVRQASGTG